MNLDIIGDIHGHSEQLVHLLEHLGYEPSQGIYQHPERKVIFLGDFIDRGPHQRGVIEIVRPMVESGSALSVMGNHEFNAIAFATPDSEGEYLRDHSAKNCAQHEVFLSEYPLGSPEHEDVITWFKTLPLWLDLGDLRAVHACWDQAWMDKLDSNRLTDDLLTAASTKGTWQYTAVETLLKGKEVPLPDGHTFYDKDGHPRDEIRIRWWDGDARTYRDVFMGPESSVTHIPDDDIEGDHLIEYPASAPPVFLGHYWLEGRPELLASNIACLDYSVAKPGGKLVAYRWDGEESLLPHRFVCVGRGSSE